MHPVCAYLKEIFAEVTELVTLGRVWCLWFRTGENFSQAWKNVYFSINTKRETLWMGGFPLFTLRPSLGWGDILPSFPHFCQANQLIFQNHRPQVRLLKQSPRAFPFPLLELRSTFLIPGNPYRSSFGMAPIRLLGEFQCDFGKERTPHAVGCLCSFTLCKSGRPIHSLNDVRSVAMCWTHGFHQ